jgi:hypothetical protein
MLKRFCSLIAMYISLYILLINKKPLLVIILLGILKQEITFVIKALVKSFAFYNFLARIYNTIFK